MSVTTTDKYWGEKLKIVQQENESLKQELLEKFKEEYEKEEEGGRRAILKISSAKPGQSPGDDRTKEPYDKDWPPPAPLAPKLAGLRISNANNIRGFQDSGYQLNIPLHDWKQIPPAIKNDPDFIRLHLRRMQALGINPMLAGGPQLPNFKPMGRVIKGVRKGVLSPEENKIKQALQIRGA